MTLFAFRELKKAGSLFNRLIVICWLLSIFFIMVYHIAKLTLELSRHRKNHDELVAVNRLLNLQNKQF